jgi:hypothetical protein
MLVNITPPLDHQRLDLREIVVQFVADALSVGHRIRRAGRVQRQDAET